jgi:hypothetical protein
MVTIKGLKKQTDCKKCPLMGTDGNPKDISSPMMCVAIWATKREIKHCVEGKILDDCPLIEIVTCKDCKNHGCGHMPRAGQMVRYNCPFYKKH